MKPTCNKVTNLAEYMQACVVNKKAAAKSGTEIKMPKLHLKTCTRKAVFTAKIGDLWHNYCASCFLRMWLHANLSKKVKLL